MTRLTDEQRKLIEDNMKLVYKYCVVNNINDEDLIQFLFYYLCKYINGYDANKGSISNFIFTHCKYAVARYYQDLNCDCRKSIFLEESLQSKPFNRDESELLTYEDMITDNKDYFDIREQIIDVYSGMIKFIKENPDKEDDAKIFWDRVNGKTYDELSELYHKSYFTLKRKFNQIQREILPYLH